MKIEPLPQDQIDLIMAAHSALQELKRNPSENLNNYKQFVEKYAYDLMLAAEALMEAENYIKAQKAA